MHPLTAGVLAFAACVVTGAVAQTATPSTAKAQTIQLSPFATQPASASAKSPEQVDSGFLTSRGAQIRFESIPQISAATVAALVPADPNAPRTNTVPASTLHGFNTIPYWRGYFDTQGTRYLFSMAGGNVLVGGPTVVNTALIPISLIFDEFKDAQGNKFTIDVTPVISRILNSPNFKNASYTTGTTQFADAVQRAEFWSVPAVQNMNWHTLLNTPRILIPVQVEVPVGSATLHQGPNGTTAIIDPNFFKSQLNTIAQLEPIHDDEIAIMVSSNTVLGTAAGCCILGVHTALQTATAVHPYGWASYLAPGLFANNFEDVAAISHEIANIIDNPFVTNVVPTWQVPGTPSPGCETMLEIADPVQGFANAVFPVAIGGFTYHPQNDAVISWFARRVPSIAIDHAFSYPNETLLTAPSQPCAP